MAKLRLLVSGEVAAYIDQVIELADANTATLGFLPHVVYKENAAKGTLLVAVDERGTLVGYLLYRVVHTQHKATIAHMCVASDFRGQGVADLLFGELKRRTQALRGIDLHCRQDYENANKLWKRLNFEPIGDKRGRGKEETTLTHWWFDHRHPTLLDLISSDKRKVVIDANVFFDLQAETPTESSALLADWLRSEIELIITPELLSEIDRNDDKNLRDKQRTRAKNFTRIHGSYLDNCQQVVEKLKESFSTYTTRNDESDLTHIAWAIADPDVNFFVTCDEKILRLSGDIYSQYGLSILHPVDLILHLDELSRVEEYRHMRVAGTQIIQRRIQSGEHDQLAAYFQNTQEENKFAFLDYLRQHLMERDADTCFVVEDGNGLPQALFVYDREYPDELRVPLLRYNSLQVGKTLIRYLLLHFQATAAKEGRRLTLVTDPHLQDLTVEALQTDTFVPTDMGWTHLNFLVAEPAHQLGQRLGIVLQERPEFAASYRSYQALLSAEDSADSFEAMSEMERLLWPAKITDAHISNISIPINSTWAREWFDHELASQTLFGANVERAFNREGVYYSAANRYGIQVPGRVLWYVTKDENLAGTQSIRACSRLDDIVIGKPKDLFRQFQHLGIYEWKQVYKTADNDINNDIMAIRFSDTILFRNPVSLDAWASITQTERGADPPIYSPSPMPEAVFERIYRLGMGLGESGEGVG